MTPPISLAAWEFRDVSAFLSLCSAVGADAIEPAPWNIESVGVDQLRRMTAQHGLDVSCVATGIAHRFGTQPTEDVQKALRKSIDDAMVLQAPLVTTYIGGGPDVDPKAFAASVHDAMAPCAKYAAEHSVTILIENVFDTTGDDPTGRMLTRTVDGCRHLLEAFSDLGVKMTLDPCNFLVAGEDPWKAFQALRPYVGNVHVKDAVKNGRPHPAATNVVWSDSVTGSFNGVHSGAGDSHLGPILQAVLDDGFTGPMTIEHVVVDVTDSETQSSYWTEVNWVREQLASQRLKA